MREKSQKTHSAKERRGVGAIIGGVILATILLTTMLIYFLTILQNDQRRTSFDIQSADNSREKATEKITAFRQKALVPNGGNNYVHTRVNNTGSLPGVVELSALYCLTCPAPSDPAVKDVNTEPANYPFTLGAGDVVFRDVGPVADGSSYRVDFITERGNIVSAYCTVVGAECQDTSGGAGGPDFDLDVPALVAITAGSSADRTITVNSIGGFSDAVDLSISPTSAGGITITPAPAIGTTNSPYPASVNIHITSSGTATGATFVVTGTSAPLGLVHSETMEVSIVTVTGAVNEGIVQGTGSLQLDFKAFGSIYPTTASDQGLASRAGINQEGWLVKSYSKYGGVTGYPGFDILGGMHTVVFVERIRNLDPSADGITLARASGLITNLGVIPNGHQASEWICNATKTFSGGDPTGGSIQSYTEASVPPRVSTIPTTPLTAAPTDGWRELYFCSATIGGGTANYHPYQTGDGAFKADDIQNGLMVVARGAFQNSKADYGQVIPYQSYTVGPASTDSFEACLRSSNSPAGLCPGPATPCNGACATAATQLLNYSSSKNSIVGSGAQVWVHLDSVPLPNKVTVSWIYHDGSIRVMNTTNGVKAQDVPIVGGYVSDGAVARALKIPTNLDACDGSHPQYYTIRVTDSFNNAGQRNVYYMTYQVRCP